eukprot:5174649-Pyramimonas_sp.AAC.2
MGAIIGQMREGGTCGRWECQTLHEGRRWPSKPLCSPPVTLCGGLGSDQSGEEPHWGDRRQAGGAVEGVPHLFAAVLHPHPSRFRNPRG